MADGQRRLVAVSNRVGPLNDEGKAGGLAVGLPEPEEEATNAAAKPAAAAAGDGLGELEGRHQALLATAASGRSKCCPVAGFQESMTFLPRSPLRCLPMIQSTSNSGAVSS